MTIFFIRWGLEKETYIRFYKDNSEYSYCLNSKGIYNTTILGWTFNEYLNYMGVTVTEIL